MNLPNALSLGRIILAIFFTIFLSLGLEWAHILAFLCFVLASITDWLDGYLARKMNLVTDLGKLLDPLADKVLVAAAFVLFTDLGLCPAWVTIAVLFREFTVTGLRLLLVEKGTVLPADQWGKWKTVFQMVFCILALFGLAFPQLGDWSLVSNIVLYLALALTLISGGNYAIKGMKILQ